MTDTEPIRVMIRVDLQPCYDTSSWDVPAFYRIHIPVIHKDEEHIIWDYAIQSKIRKGTAGLIAMFNWLANEYIPSAFKKRNGVTVEELIEMQPYNESDIYISVGVV